MALSNTAVPKYYGIRPAVEFGCYGSNQPTDQRA
jgi:hypothetical protein